MDKFKKMSRDAAKWAASPEGKKAIHEALEQAMETTQRLLRKQNEYRA